MVPVASRAPLTGSRRLGVLPAEATSFVGRTAELAAIIELLGAARLVTVVGPAGVGKTRTSRHAAAALAGQYPDGVWYADLADISQPGQVADAAAAALGLPGTGGTDGEAAVLGRLRGKRLLLILDTCEHLVDACAAFADTVLRSAAGVTLLAASRQPLDAPGEHAFPLLPLPAETDAVQLFAQRAEAVVPGFAVTPQNQADVARLCRRLDGLPLAIEFAAVRLRALPLAELTRQLETGIRTLTVTRRGTSPRQQTLRAAVEWSYRLCTPAEQVLWQRLSVFPGTFDVSGSEHVCADDGLPREQILPALVGLVDKSVVVRDPADPARYRLLGLLREFGADRLAETGGPGPVLARLTTWCLALARDFDEQFRRTGYIQAAALRRLHREYGSVHAALGYALAPREPSGDAVAVRGPGAPAARWRLGANLAVRLAGYWQVSGLLDEGKTWLDSVAVLFPGPGRERARALGARGHLATLQGDLDSALADLSESVRLAAAAGPGGEAVLARGYLHLNLALALAGRPADVLAAAGEARQRMTGRERQAGLPALEAQLALLHLLAGDSDSAIGCYERGQTVLDESGPAAPGRKQWISGYLSLACGTALARQPGREQAGGVALRRALAILHELGDVLGTAYAVEAVAWLTTRREQCEHAAWLIGAADQLWAGTGLRLSDVPPLEESRQRTVKAARKALGERRYTAAYAHGAALDLDAVVAEAADAADAAAGLSRGRGGYLADGVPPAPSWAVAALTRREREIAELVASGLFNREIAERLFISKRTVDAHVDHIFSKLELSSRVQLTVLLRQPAPLAQAAGE